MNVRRYLESDLEIILPWFERRKWPNLSSIFPEDGWVAEDSSGPIAAIWLYKCGPIGFVEWSVTNPDMAGMKTLKALRLCLEKVQDFATSEGMHSLIQFIPDERLVKFYEKHCGFRETEKATLMVWNRG